MSEFIDELPKEEIALTKKALNKQKKLDKKKRLTEKSFQKTEHGFMYIGHLPHGFYEEEIKSYFSQFGKIVRVRLARSKLTGNHKGYGFIEFKDKEVAQIAAETMNNYLMFNKILKCHLIPKDKLHPATFKNARKKFFVPLKCMFRKKFNSKKSVEQLKRMHARQDSKMEKQKQKLKESGINLDLTKIVT
jgi:nucleolar protein 15